MLTKSPRTKLQAIADNLFFPSRAFFIPEENQISPTLLREEQFEVVAKHSTGRVLDIGCGKDKQYSMSYAEIPGYLNTRLLKFARQIKVMWGLNNLYLGNKNTSISL